MIHLLGVAVALVVCVGFISIPLGVLFGWISLPAGVIAL
jgi:hypothetical protein